MIEVIIFIVNASAVFLWMFLLTKLGKSGIRQRNNTTVLPVFLLAGIIAAVAALVLELVIGFIAPGSYRPSVVELFLEHILAVGLVEEGCKFYFFTLFLGKRKNVHDPRDGMVLAMATALGFSGFENLGYGLNYGIGVLLFRVIFSTLAHVSYAGLWGYVYTSIRCHASEKAAEKHEKQALASILLIAAFLHGLSNVISDPGGIGAYLLIRLISLLPVILAYRYIGRVVSGKVAEPSPRQVPRRVSTADRYRMHYNAALVSLKRRKYDRALTHIGYCRRIKRDELSLLFLQGVCLYALGRRLKGYGAMASALTDMDSGSTAKIKAGLGKLITNRELKEAVMGVIDEE